MSQSRCWLPLTRNEHAPHVHALSHPQLIVVHVCCSFGMNKLWEHAKGVVQDMTSIWVSCRRAQQIACSSYEAQMKSRKQTLLPSRWGGSAFIFLAHPALCYNRAEMSWLSAFSVNLIAVLQTCVDLV